MRLAHRSKGCWFVSACALLTDPYHRPPGQQRAQGRRLHPLQHPRRRRANLAARGRRRIYTRRRRTARRGRERLNPLSLRITRPVAAGRRFPDCGLAERGAGAGLAERPGTAGLDACWEELRRQAEDGTARAWISLCSAGLIDRSARNAAFEDAAREAVVDGCAVALATGVPLADARDAYDALWLTLLEVTAKR